MNKKAIFNLLIIQNNLNELKFNKNMPEKLNIGGQAVIEGVMIRGPKYNVVAVRKNKKIIIKKDKIKLHF